MFSSRLKKCRLKKCQALCGGPGSRSPSSRSARHFAEVPAQEVPGTFATAMEEGGRRATVRGV